MIHCSPSLNGIRVSSRSVVSAGAGELGEAGGVGGVVMDVVAWATAKRQASRRKRPCHCGNRGLWWLATREIRHGEAIAVAAVQGAEAWNITLAKELGRLER